MIAEMFVHFPLQHFLDRPAEKVFERILNVLMAPSFEAAMKKYGVQYDMIIAQGMYHCYPVYPLVREAKEGWEQMIMLLKEWKNG
ncbi:MAG: hypothetical protein K6C13_08620 [Oscillospiraceae bacterium]|nr:hypothetical protein [Oscillospiraceae bacterium]